MRHEHLSPKVVVFDLDETLGYFTEFGIFYQMLVRHLNVPLVLHQQLFNAVFDLYPEYLRPDILNILDYLKRKKKSGECHKVLIYTNNRGSPKWREMIKEYFHKKLNYPLFDRIVGAFKVNGRVIEVCRTTNDKTTDDLIRCAKLPEKSHICFIDNTEYELMDNVYYIKLNTYIHNLSMKVVVNRFLASSVFRKIGGDAAAFVRYIQSNLSMYTYECSIKVPKEYEIDKIVSKRLAELISEFFD